MDKKSETLKILQRARDEAHRFSIKASRNAKIRSIKSVKLDTIRGIGPIKRNMLIKKYGSLKNILKQSAKEISSNPGINNALAELILKLK